MIGRQNILLKNLLRNAKPGPVGSRAFSSQVATTGSDAAPSGGIQTLWQYSDAAMAKNAAKEEGESAYLDTLKQASTVPGAFNKLSETGSS